MSAAQASYIFAPLLGVHSRVFEVILDAASEARDLRDTLVCSDKKVAQEKAASTETMSSQQEKDLSDPLPVLNLRARVPAGRAQNIPSTYTRIQVQFKFLETAPTTPIPFLIQT